MTDETELTTEQRATAKLWADRIIADHRAHARGAPKQYPTLPEWIAIKGEGHLLELPTPAGKPVGECTFLEAAILGEAFKIAADRLDALGNAARLLAAELQTEAVS
jgi:hypothetical protein